MLNNLLIPFCNSETGFFIPYLKVIFIYYRYLFKFAAVLYFRNF